MLSTSFVSLLLTGLICTLIGGYRIGELSMKLSHTDAQLELTATSVQIQERLAATFDVVRTLAQTFQSFKERNSMLLTRQDLAQMLTVILSKNPSVLGFWTLWEPNAFDGQDQKFANTPMHDATGRVVMYLLHGADGKIIGEANRDYEVPGAGDYYLIARRLQKEVIMDPYIYNNVLMTSLVVPIIVQGKFLGVVGADMKLDFLQRMLENRAKGLDQERLVLLSQTKKSGRILRITAMDWQSHH
jgi:methyl-accepting chemotaxis protein